MSGDVGTFDDRRSFIKPFPVSSITGRDIDWFLSARAELERPRPCSIVAFGLFWRAGSEERLSRRAIEIRGWRVDAGRPLMDDRRRSSIGRIEPKRILQRRGLALPETRFETKSVRDGRGRVKNVSQGGLFVLTSDIPLVGESVHFVFQDDAFVWIELVGAVRWIGQREDESGESGFGLEIEDEPKEYRAYVRRLTRTK